MFNLFLFHYHSISHREVLVFISSQWKLFSRQPKGAFTIVFQQKCWQLKNHFLSFYLALCSTVVLQTQKATQLFCILSHVPYLFITLSRTKSRKRNRRKSHLRVENVDALVSSQDLIYATPRFHFFCSFCPSAAARKQRNNGTNKVADSGSVTNSARLCVKCRIIIKIKHLQRNARATNF